MKLLYTKRSPYARKTRVVALEKNIKLDLIEENLTKKSGQLLRANPIGKIPTLILNNGETLIDSPVICEYLDGLNDTPVLIPKNNKERIDALHLQAIADGLMDVTVALYMEKVRHPNDFNQAFVTAQQETIANTLAYLDKDITQIKELSLAAIAVACAIGYLNFRLSELNPQGRFPKLQAWFEEFSKRPSLAQTAPVA
ncbi:MAG TPA: glutathione S-transferase N-terminal domain-containing protein [Candidatus Omnitrophota bacterium]|nr:glutathione S-transferase N-terminal domain-containing protein [Candidatus Omnitrophota bacterium]